MLEEARLTAIAVPTLLWVKLATAFSVTFSEPTTPSRPSVVAGSMIVAAVVPL